MCMVFETITSKKEKIIVNHESRECCVRAFAIISKNELAFYVNAHTPHSFTLCSAYGLQKQNEKKYSSHFFASSSLLFSSLLVFGCLALATNECVARFLKIFTSNRAAFFCPSHDVHKCMVWKLHTMLFAAHTSESFSVVFRFFSSSSVAVVVLIRFSLYDFYYTKHHQISWSCLLSIVPFSLHV